MAGLCHDEVIVVANVTRTRSNSAMSAKPSSMGNRNDDLGTIHIGTQVAKAIR